MRLIPCPQGYLGRVCCFLDNFQFSDGAKKVVNTFRSKVVLYPQTKQSFLTSSHVEGRWSENNERDARNRTVLVSTSTRNSIMYRRTRYPSNHSL